MNGAVTSLKLLALILLITLPIGCEHDDDEGPSQVNQVFTEHHFGENPDFRADPENHLIVKFLEHPDHDEHENDTGGIGHDVIPHTYERTVDHTFCWEDEDPDAEHFMVIEDSEGNEIVTLFAGDCVTETILEGDYDMVIHHDGKIDKNHPIFIRHGHDEDLMAAINNKPPTMLEITMGFFYKTLDRLDIDIIKTTYAQTLEDNINTLITNNSCAFCDLKNANLSGANLHLAFLHFADLRNADLSFADLSFADLRSANLDNAILSGANLSNTHASRITLRFANLNDANLNDADLPSAILSFANLKGADFSNADLSFADFTGADLTGADFTGADLIGAEFNGATWTNGAFCQEGVSFGGNCQQITLEIQANINTLLNTRSCPGCLLIGVVLSNENLSGANLRGTNFTDANLTGADLSFANLSPSNLSFANLEGANLTGTDFSSAIWIDGFTLCKDPSVGMCIPVDFIEILLTTGVCQNCSLNGADLSGENLEGAILTGSVLTGANLSGANLSNADLSGTVLNVANLAGANLTGANLTGANLSGSNLSNADLSGAVLDNANLSDSVLQDANLTGAGMAGANLMNANLSGAVLDNANLLGASMFMSNLSFASIVGTVLTGADLSLAIWVDGVTICGQPSIGMCVALEFP